MRKPRFLLPLFALAATCGLIAGESLAQPSPPALAQPARHVPTDAGSMRLSFAPVVKETAPAVVSVYAKKVVRQSIDPFFSQFAMPGLTQERVMQSLGSGVVVRSDGVIVTNNHVIEGGQDIMVVLSDRREFPAKVLLADGRVDLAVLKIDVGSEKLPVLPIDDRGDQQVGDLVLAVGNPFGVGQTVTNGIISALDRSASDPGAGDGGSSYIQTDAPINPGNSGGALVDMDGNLIGINSFIVSRSGGSSGVGFAIPAALVKRVVETAAGGSHTLVRPWLGTKTDPVTADIGKSLGMSAPSGALVTDLYPGSPAERAGIKVGDVIVGVDGGAVVDPGNLNYRIATKAPGEATKVELLRDGKRVGVTVRVEPPPATPAKDEQTLSGRNPLTGLTVVNLSPAVADELGADPFVKGSGVLVSGVASRGYGASVGFQPGDIVRAVNGHDVSTVEQLRKLLDEGAPSGLWTLTIQRGGRTITARIRA